jgi:hypothetical protein
MSRITVLHGIRQYLFPSSCAAAHVSDIAVTARGFEVLSTTERSTDGTASHWKYTKGNAIVYSDVYLLGFDTRDPTKHRHHFRIVHDRSL